MVTQAASLITIQNHFTIKTEPTLLKGKTVTGNIDTKKNLNIGNNLEFGKNNITTAAKKHEICYGYTVSELDKIVIIS